MKVKPPILPREMPAVPMSGLEDDDRIERVMLRDIDFSHMRGRGVRMEQVRFERSNLQQATLPRFMGLDMILSSCDLANLEISECELNRVSLENCRVTGLIAGGGDWTHVSLKECKLNLSNFRSCKLGNVLFRDCDLSGCDFSSASCSDVAFVNCNLAGATFAGANLRSVDLRTSQIAELISANGLGGATIDPGQAVEIAALLAKEMGIKIDREGRLP